MPRETRRERGVDVARDRRKNPADNEIAVQEIALQPSHEIIGARLDFLLQALASGRLDTRRRLSSHRFEQPNGVAARRAPRDLARAENRSRIGNVGEGKVVRRERRTDLRCGQDRPAV